MKTFKTRWWLVPICEKLTNHRYNKLVMWTRDFEDRNFKYPNRSDFHYKCKICGLLFFNHNISKEDLERIKREAKNRDVSCRN